MNMMEIIVSSRRVDEMTAQQKEPEYIIPGGILETMRSLFFEALHGDEPLGTLIRLWGQIQEEVESRPYNEQRIRQDEREKVLDAFDEIIDRLPMADGEGISDEGQPLIRLGEAMKIVDDVKAELRHQKDTAEQAKPNQQQGGKYG